MKHYTSQKQRSYSTAFFLAAALILLGGTQALAQATVDCNLAANCNDAACVNVEKGCKCEDGVDNDGDGTIDKADTNCASYYGLSFVGEGSDCSILPDATSNPFDSMTDTPIESSQNTADTQSKVSVGDVDGDGIPDAVVTSKENSAVRVVATRGGQPDGTQAGSEKSLFNLTGNPGKTLLATAGVAAGDVAKIKFEHENLIADIDRNGISEIFTVASLRNGPGNDPPPSRFYLIAYTYSPATLTPMYAIDIGTNRPGAFGIADFDFDGKGEIYMRDRIYAAETGKLLATGNGNWDLDISSGPVAVNIKGTADAKLDLVCGTKIFEVPSLPDRTGGSLVTLSPWRDMNTLTADKCFVKMINDLDEYGLDTHSMTSVADMDKDGNIDVVISGALNSTSGPTAVFYWNVSKGTISHYLPPDGTDANGWPWGTSRINLYDLTEPIDSDGDERREPDGFLEMTFIAGNRLFCVTTNAAGQIIPPGTPASGAVWPTFRSVNDSRSGVVGVTIYDFNNDGQGEIVYRDSKEVAVIDGDTGANKLWFAKCESHTYTETPVIADVDGINGTDICVTCNTSNSFDEMAGLSQQALGQFRLYYSTSNEWLPTRKVWNQHGYFVVNINDDLTLPNPQFDQSFIFGTSDCPNGLPGPQMPMNVFLNQVPNLSASGCPVFPAPDLSYVGDNPDTPGVDENGDGVYTPTVEVIPPICGDLAIQVRFNIINDGDLPISGSIPVSFFKADPTVAGITAADMLFSTNIDVVNLQVDQTLTTPFVSFNGTGGTFRLYIVLNNNGSTLPINLTGSTSNECRIDNNMYSVNIVPDPFITKIEKIQDNYKCSDTAPNSGEVRVRIFKGGIEQMDYSPYAFQWHTGDASNAVPIADAINYNLTGLAEGDYTALVTNTEKGCVGILVDTTVVRLGNDPVVTITKISDQTLCNPPNGALQASIAGGNTGFTFEWLDTGLTPLGISGPDATNLLAGNYVLKVSKDGCEKNVPSPIVQDPQIPDGSASVLQHVVDCINPNTGSVTAEAILSTVVQDPANYTFDWYFYNISTNTPGSILPATYGTGVTRTGLPPGGYQVVITDNVTQCESLQKPVVEVTSQTVIPAAFITETLPQTSCDPAQPNGVLTASATAAGLVSPNDFTFEWFKGDNTLPENKVTTVSGLKGEILNQVSGGGIPYTVKITTSNNCSGTFKLAVSEVLNVPVLTLTELTPNSVCDDTKASASYNGSVQATVTFGGNTVTLPDPSYTFVWYGGTAVIDPVIAVSDPQSPLLSGLKDGDYTATVERTDLFCKSVPQTQTVSKATVLPILTATSTGSNNCDAALTPDGTVTVLVNNPLPGDVFSYQWYSGNAVGVNPLGAANNGTTATAIKVGGPSNAPNQYTVEVLNTTTGCVNNTTQFVADNSIIPVLSFTSIVPNSMCDPAKFNGSLTTQVANIPAGYTINDYTFRWYDGQTTVTLHTPASVTSILDQLDAGFYTVDGLNTLTGCQSSPITNQVPNTKIFPTLLASSTGSNNCDPLLTPDGTVSYSVTNIQAGDIFSQQWYTGAAIVAGNELPAANNGTSVTAINVGGPTGAPNSYTVFVSNTTTGCTNFTTTTVPDVSVVPVLTTSVLPNAMCDPAKFNGSMTVDVTNIPALYTIADYDFTWRDATSAIVQGPGASTVLSNVEEGAYTVVGINRETGCISSSAGNNVPSSKIFPALTPSSTGSTNCDPLLTPDGTATVAVSGTTGPHTFQWYEGIGDPIAGAFPAVPLSNNGQSATAIDLGGPVAAPHAYSVLVTDTGTGCSNFTTTMVADISFIPVLSFGLITPNTICSPATLFDGEMNVQVDNIGSYAITDFAFTWYDGNTTTTLHSPQPSAATDDKLTLLDVAQYTVEGTNTLTGCKSSPITSQVPDGKIYPAISITTTGSFNCTTNVDADGTATATITNNGAGDPLSFLWSAVGPTAAITNPANNIDQATAIKLGGPVNAPNTYNVLVTNTRTGCFNNAQGLVADLSMKPTLTLQPFENHVCDIALITSGPQQFDGRVDITAVNYNGVAYAGTSSLTYEWFDVDAANVITGTNGTSTTTTLPNLDNDKYAATVTIDDLDCTSDPVIAEVLDDLTIPAITTAVTANTNCPGGAIAANGSAEVTFVDGNAVPSNYKYQWYNGAIVDAGQIRAVDINPVLSNTIQGTETFTVEVTNELTGCVGNAPMTVTDARVIPTIAVTLAQNNTICDITLPGGPTRFNGALLATPIKSGLPMASGSYTINWTGTGTIAGTDGEHFTELAAASYTAHVIENATGCQSADDTGAIIDDLTYPDIEMPATPQTTCAGTPNGEITATDATIIAGRTFEWFTGIGTSTPLMVDGGDPSNRIDDLASGDFTVRITIDATGCAATENNFVPDNITIPSISFVGVNPVTSCAAANGEATASIADLSAPMTYDIFYVYTTTLSGAAYPTDPADIKTAVDPANHTYTTLLNQNVVPTAVGNLIPGYLTALAIDKNTLCESAPATQQILDNTVKSNINLTLHASPGICGSGFGGIDPIVTPLAAGVYTYEWYVGAPTNTTPINFFNNQPAFDVALNPTGQIYADNGANLGINHAPAADNSISPGTFTLVVRDPDGCGTYKTDNVPTSTIPDLDITPTHITRCDISNGQLAVQVLSGSSTTGYSLEVFSGNDDSGASLGSIGLSPISTSLTVSALPEGPYFVKLLDGDNPTCPLGESATLTKMVLPPLIAVDQIVPNTSCDPSTAADGKVDITVTNANGDVEPKNYHVLDVSPLPVGFTLNPSPGNIIGTGASGQSTGLINGFEPGATVPSYTITVKDDLSKCETDLVVIIPDQQSIPSDLNLNITPETACEPLSNGSALASLAGGEATTIFDFDWYKNNDGTASTTGSVAGNVANTGGELLDQSKVLVPADWTMGATGKGSSDRVFYVQGVKNATAPSGVGCKTQLVQVVIPDQHISPDMTLTAAFNSFCNAIAGGTPGDGSITIDADADPATVGNQNPAGGFSYAWTNSNGALASPQTDDEAFLIPQLGTGNYQVTATNLTNQCNVVNTVAIDPAPFVITITARDIIDQRICNNDGEIEITQIDLTDQSAGAANSENHTNALIDPIYDFQWYDNAALTGGSELQDITPAQIVTRTLSIDGDQDLITEAGDYPAMAAGTYYVVATRRITAPVAAGCPSLPFRVEIQDVHNNPVPQLTALSNTSCLPVGPGEGEIIINVTDATNTPHLPGTGFTYTYTWNGPGPVPVAPNNVPGAGNGDGSSLDGDDDHYTQLLDDAAPYVLTIENDQTGCVVNASATIIKNATPVFVQSVAVLDEIYCSPTGDGSITVTTVSMNDRTGASQDFVSAPVGPQGDIANFNFEWTRDAIANTQTTAGAILDKTTYDATGAGFGTPIGAGTYTVTARRVAGTPGAGCPSAPFQVTIQNKQILPVAILTPFANTSCSSTPADLEGEITIEVTDNSPATGPAGFTYTWGANPTAIPAAASPAPNDGDADGTDGDEDHPTQLLEGDYTMTVTSNKSGCTSNASTKILKNTTPVFIQNVDVLNQVLCGPDGSLTVATVTLNDRNGTTQVFDNTTTPNISDFEFHWQRTASAFTQITPGPVLNSGTYDASGTGFAIPIGFDTYTVTARRINGGPGSGCPSAPYNVAISDRRIFPVVTLTPIANTSCDPLFFEGEIKVEVTDASVNLPAPLTGAPFVYNYNWTTSATPGIISGVVAGTHDGDGFGSGETDLTPAIDNDGDHPAALQEGTYTIEVTNTQTGCPSTATTTIFKNSTPVFTQLVTPTDQVLCNADGKLVVNEVRVVDKDGVTQSSLTDFPISDFEFTYSRTTPGNVLPGGITATQLDNVNYPAIGADTYFVVATRRTGAPGKDCFSPPYKVDILDKALYPVVSLTPLANTSCDPAFFEGEIRVNVIDNSVNIPAPLAGAPFSYAYNWTASATPAMLNGVIPGTHDGDGFGGGETDLIPAIDNDGDHPAGLQDGNYTIEVTNTQTGCPSIGSTTIFKNSTPVFTQLVVPTDQVICNPDGMLLVQEVKVIDRDGNVQSNLTGDFLLSDFVFSYDRGTIGNNVIDNTNPSQPLIQLDNTTYAGIGFDSYYVVATRTNGGPGLNCSSAPYKVDIQDKRLFPKVAFTSLANSSCSESLPNGSVTANASEQNGTATDPYTFTWILNNGPLSPASTQTDNSPSSIIANAIDGTYVVTATNTTTGCPIDASFNLLLDQTMSTPNIIEVFTIDPTDCYPTAQAEVTKITLGSTSNSVLFPPNMPPNNEVTGADLLNFNYNWYQSGTTPADQVPSTGPPYFSTPCIGPNCATPTQGLVPGTYYVFVEDPRTECQSGPKEVVITDDDIVYPVLAITQTIPQMSCVPGVGTAELEAVADGRNDTDPDYSFSWFRNLTTTPPSFMGTSTVSNLVAGDYSVSVTYAVTGCSASQLFIIPDEAPKFLPELSLTTLPRINCLVNDGSLLAREVGYKPGSGYSFIPDYITEIYPGTNADVSQPGTVLANVPGFSLNWTSNGLDIGIYTIKITDNNTGCVVTAEEEVMDGRTPPVVMVIEDNPLTYCEPVPPNGQLSASADNGQVGGYTFDWYSGPTVTGSILQSNNKLIGETIGNFTVRVTNDATGCFADGTGEITPGMVYPPAPDAVVKQHKTHCIIPDGKVSATVDGVILNFLFNWYDGSEIEGAADFTGVDYTQRDIGPYTVTATDVVTGCISEPATVIVEDKTEIPTLVFKTTPSFCEDVPSETNTGTGVIEVYLQPSYLQSDEIVWFDEEGNTAGTGSYITGLYPGTYDAFVRTTKGCDRTGSALVGTEVLAYNLVTRNGDQKNDMFVVDCISRFPNNNVKIFNRAGVKVYEATGYNNSDVVFQGLGEEGVYTAGKDLPAGTYFYVIDKRDGSKPKTGYLELVK